MIELLKNEFKQEEVKSKSILTPENQVEQMVDQLK